jgi:N-acetylneuraminic acid mutarotase
MPLKALVGMLVGKNSGRRARLLILVLLSCAAGARAQVEIEWREGPKLPMPLGGHSAVVMGEGIVVAGGSNWPEGKKVWRDEIFVLRESEWKQAAKLPAGLTLSAAVVKDQKLLLLGGWYESGTTSHAYAYADGKVERVALDLPAARAQAGAGVIGNTIYVVGGMTDAADFSTAINSVIRFQHGMWTRVASLPQPLALASTVIAKDKIYLFGGMGPVSGKATDSAHAFVYDPQQDRWTKLAPLPAARRGAGSVVLDDRHVLLLGGCRNENDQPVMLDVVLSYDTVEHRYGKSAPLPFSALCVAAVVKDGEVWAIGGEDLPKHRTDRVVIGRVKRLGK